MPGLAENPVGGQWRFRPQFSGRRSPPDTGPRRSGGGYARFRWRPGRVFVESSRGRPKVGPALARAISFKIQHRCVRSSMASTSLIARSSADLACFRSCSDLGSGVEPLATKPGASPDGNGVDASARKVVSPPPQPMVKNSTRIPSLFSNSTRIITLVRVATSAEITPVVAVPAPSALAALTVAETTENGKLAGAEQRTNRAGSDALESDRSRRDRRSPRIVLARDRRPETVPTGQPSWSAASWWVLPSISQSRTGSR